MPSNQQELAILHHHFELLYRMLPEYQFIPQAQFKEEKGFKRSLSGIPFAFHNAIIGCPEEKDPALIEKQLKFFSEVKMPFAWYLDENDDPAFMQALIRHGFIDAGIFQGVIGPIDATLFKAPLPDGYQMKKVNDTATFDAFYELIASTFGMQGISKSFYKRMLKEASLIDPASSDPHMAHWVVKKEDQVVSAVSTLLHQKAASFWNGATLPEYRRLGLSTALRQLALEDALSKGCHLGMSYLMAEAMALGICKNLGFKPKWRIKTYLAPSLPA